MTQKDKMIWINDQKLKFWFKNQQISRNSSKHFQKLTENSWKTQFTGNLTPLSCRQNGEKKTLGYLVASKWRHLWTAPKVEQKYVLCSA